MTELVGEALTARLALNRERQRELYGIPLGDRVRRLTTGLGISQARLARALGVSPAMLSQLVSARRVKIGDPAVLARLMMIDQRSRGVREVPPRHAVDAMLADVARVRWQWAGPRVPPQGGAPPQRARRNGTAAEALRGVAAPARLAAAAAALGPGFPELAEVLRQAACRPGA
jgi:transcriptional regulator with XRE-family HTH domain